MRSSIAVAVVTSSSVREVPLEVTWQRARSVAASLGITRVTETTWLDRVGVPVAVGVRPSATPGSLCVSAGKGMTVDEAMVGATMEAIEFAWTEYNRAGLEVTRVPARLVLEGATRPLSLLDLCPIWGRTFDGNALLDCVEMTDIVTGERFAIPAELVFHPYQQNRGPHFFGTSTNGLSSGNTVDEATAHGLCELLERDILSFHKIRGRTFVIDPQTLPPHLAAVARTLDERGFDLSVRSLPNAFDMPCFLAVSSDREQRRMTLPGSGAHPSVSIAATRAICETIQARLTLIHGGRDDLTNVWQQHQGKSREQVEREYQDVLAAFGSSAQLLPLDQAFADHAPGSVSGLLGHLVDRLAARGFRRILRIVYTPPDYPVQVVRVIVPRLEFYSRETQRRGPRLVEFIRTMPVEGRAN
jgi:ribosomal protein S12 methylthiotransferase accessory factor